MNEKPRLLIVDDEAAMRELTLVALEPDFLATAVASGEEALRSVAARRPDAILLDVEMAPGIDGYDTCRRLKADEATTDIPVIFVSAHDAIEDRLKGYEAGGEDYIVKPFDLPELEAKLWRLLKAVGERAGLRRLASDASSTAMTAMTNMSELGALLEAIKRIGNCNDGSSLADAVVSGMALYGLHGTAQLRSPEGTITRTGEGDATPLEASVIGHMASMERITQFKSRLAITYKHVSLLVHNLPTDDPERCGRLRDHLAMLAEGAESRAETIAATAESQRRGHGIEHAVARITATLGDIDQAQRQNQVTVRLAVEDLTERMQSAYVSVALSAAQEDLMNDILAEGLGRLLNAHTDVAGLQDRLSSIVRELEGLSGANRR